MTTSADLYAAATDLGRKAAEHDATADQLELTARPLDGLLTPIRHWHTAETWSSSAATASRSTLARQHVVTLAEVRRELAMTVRLLRSRAEGLRADQGHLRRQADAAADAERRAAERPPPAGDPTATRPFVFDFDF